MLDSVIYAKDKYLAEGGSGWFRILLINSALGNQMNPETWNKLCMNEEVPTRDEKCFH